MMQDQPLKDSEGKLYVSFGLTWSIYHPHRLPHMAAGACLESESPMLINDSRKCTDYVRRSSGAEL